MNTLDKDSIETIYSENDGTLKKFNIENFTNSMQPATKLDVKNLANVKRKNYFLPDQNFTTIIFALKINNIDSATFDLIQYLPNIINDVQDIDHYDDATHIKNVSILQNQINENVMNANEIQCFKIMTNELKCDEIKSDQISTNELKIGNRIFNDIVAWIDSLPLNLNEYEFHEFNTTFNNIKFILKPKVKIIIKNVDNDILYYKYNESDNKMLYDVNIQYNDNFHKIIIKY